MILDEIHHAGDDRAWGEAVRRAFEAAPRRLALSGTPFRSDTLAIPFVRYVGDEAVPDFEYGYADALGDGRVVRPVYFPRINGFMEWIAPDGSAQAAAFDDPLDRTRAAQRLRTALSLDGEWLATVLLQANERLTALRRAQPDAGGLVIAADQDHAQGIADLLRYRCGVRATVAVSDDPLSSSRIARFAAASDPWIVAVRMVSEGVDIPRLRVGVYATTTTTELFFRQAVGRFVRWTRGVPRQKAYLFIPDDVRLRTWATQIADARRHSLRKPTDVDAALDRRGGPRRAAPRGRPRRPAVDVRGPVGGGHGRGRVVGVRRRRGVARPARAARPDRGRRRRRRRAGAGPAGASRRARRAGPAWPATGSGNGDAANPRRQRAELREANAKLVQDLVWATGMGHAQVNGQLNRLVGLRRVDEATIDQLRRRAQQAERWLATL